MVDVFLNGVHEVRNDVVSEWLIDNVNDRILDSFNNRMSDGILHNEFCGIIK